MAKIKKNLAALIAFFLLILSALTFPLFGTSLFGESFSNKNSVIVNLIKDIFTESGYLNSTSGVLQFILVIFFLTISIFYLLNGIGALYNRYSRYASLLSLGYFVVGLMLYNELNNQYSASLFGFEISSITIGLGIYFVPLVGIAYLIFSRTINRNIRM